MANGVTGYFDLSNSQYGITMRINYAQTYDVSTNSSTVQITSIQAATSNNPGQQRYLNGYVSIDGVTAVSMSSAAGTHSIYISSTNSFSSVSGSMGSVSGITHSTDGSRTVSISVSIQSYRTSGSADWSISGSRSVTLATIPRSSSFTVSDGTLGVEQTIKVTKAGSSLAHTITYKCGVASGTVCTNSTSTSIKFTPPLDLAGQNTTGSNLTMTFTLQTMYGGEEVGSPVSKTVAMVIPASVKPVCKMTYMDEAGYESRFGGYLQGQSKLTVALTGEMAYGSEIASYKTVINNYSYTEQRFTTVMLTGTGEQTITATVTDKRGRTSDPVVATINVIPYTTPKITALSVHRCDEDGNEKSDGSFSKVTYSYEIVSLNGKNISNITLRYKKSSESTYVPVVLDGEYVVENGVYIFPAEDETSYDVFLEVADAIASAQRKTSVSTTDVIMHFRANGRGMGVGKLSEKEASLDVGWDINMYEHRICDVAPPVDAGDAVNKGSLLDLIYPVGIVCRLKSGVDPNNVFGGSWQQTESSASGVTWERTG